MLLMGVCFVEGVVLVGFLWQKGGLEGGGFWSSSGEDHRNVNAEMSIGFPCAEQIMISTFLR